MSVSELRLARSTTAAAHARAFVRDEVVRRGLAERAGDAELAASELVTNALVHTRGDVVVRVMAGETGGLRVEVADESALLPTPGQLERSGMSGRGLLLVAQLTDGWGATPDGDGKRVWFALSREPAARGELTVEALLRLWGDDDGHDQADPGVERDVLLSGLSTAELVAAKARGEDLCREMALIVRHPAGRSRALLRVARRLDALMHELAPMRVAIRRQALVAAARQDLTVDVRLRVSVTDADRILDYADCLDAADELARAGELLTGPPSASAASFRRGYLRAIADQVRGRHPAGPGSNRLQLHGS